ncbi:hypothetical protein [Pontibacter pamirensis]|uniref:hypothetical protein n=1 Tax=Pontibacter pamirensis TaxID=2562824 RepID=UPI00138A3917|nr:hypothetical protein [Pontibacter pamirensis]
MKKLFLLPVLLTLFLFVGCDKEEAEEPDSMAELVKGEWVRNLVTNVYYNSSGAVEYSDKEVGVINYTITEGNITTLYKAAANQVANYTYTISKEDGKRLINLTNQSGRTETYELVSVTEQKMVWRVEETDHTYTKAGGWRQAAKYVRTIEFEK